MATLVWKEEFNEAGDSVQGWPAANWYPMATKTEAQWPDHTRIDGSGRFYGGNTLVVSLVKDFNSLPINPNYPTSGFTYRLYGTPAYVVRYYPTGSYIEFEFTFTPPDRNASALDWEPAELTKAEILGGQNPSIPTSGFFSPNIPGFGQAAKYFHVYFTKTKVYVWAPKNGLTYSNGDSATFDVDNYVELANDGSPITVKWRYVSEALEHGPNNMSRLREIEEVWRPYNAAYLAWWKLYYAYISSSPPYSGFNPGYAPTYPTYRADSDALREYVKVWKGSVEPSAWTASSRYVPGTYINQYYFSGNENFATSVYFHTFSTGVHLPWEMNSLTGRVYVAAGIEGFRSYYGGEKELFDGVRYLTGAGSLPAVGPIDLFSVSSSSLGPLIDAAHAYGTSVQDSVGYGAYGTATIGDYTCTISFPGNDPMYSRVASGSGTARTGVGRVRTGRKAYQFNQIYDDLYPAPLTNTRVGVTSVANRELRYLDAMYFDVAAFEPGGPQHSTQMYLSPLAPRGQDFDDILMAKTVSMVVELPGGQPAEWCNIAVAINLQRDWRLTHPYVSSLGYPAPPEGLLAWFNAQALVPNASGYIFGTQTSTHDVASYATAYFGKRPTLLPSRFRIPSNIEDPVFGLYYDNRKAMLTPSTKIFYGATPEFYSASSFTKPTADSLKLIYVRGPGKEKYKIITTTPTGVQTVRVSRRRFFDKRTDFFTNFEGSPKVAPLIPSHPYLASVPPRYPGFYLGRGWPRVGVYSYDLATLMEGISDDLDVSMCAVYAGDILGDAVPPLRHTQRDDDRNARRHQTSTSRQGSVRRGPQQNTYY